MTPIVCLSIQAYCVKNMLKKLLRIEYKCKLVDTVVRRRRGEDLMKFISGHATSSMMISITHPKLFHRNLIINSGGEAFAKNAAEYNSNDT